MHPIENILQTTMSELRPMVDVNTIVGDAFVTPAGSTVIPISKVSFGFIAGGGEYCAEDHKNRTPAQENFPFAGGTGAGVSGQPVGVLVVGNGTVKVLPAQSNSAMERMVELLPQLVEEFAPNGEKSGKKKNAKSVDMEIEPLDDAEGQM